MVTLYDLLDVKSTSSKEEIEESYKSLIVEYATNPNLSEEENKENELIISKLKMAYEILIDDEKRKKYDATLAKKKAEALLQNVSIKHEEKIEEKEQPALKEELVENDEIAQISPVSQVDEEENDIEENVELTKEEQKKLRQAAQKEFKTNLKKAQKAEEEYQQAYNEAYNNYLRKMGYQVKEPWTLKRVKNVVILIFAIIITCVLLWVIPPTRNILINLYKENFIIKSLVDIVGMLINAILSIFK